MSWSSNEKTQTTEAYSIQPDAGPCFLRFITLAAREAVHESDFSWHQNFPRLQER